MRKITLTLIFTVVFSSTSFADWTKVGSNSDGKTYYVDFERIRKHDGYVYWWELVDFLKPDKWGDLSSKAYTQGDCKLFRVKNLSFSFHKEPMGEGRGETATPTGKNKDWIYPTPNSSFEIVLKEVCEYAN